MVNVSRKTLAAAKRAGYFGKKMYMQALQGIGKGNNPGFGAHAQCSRLTPPGKPLPAGAGVTLNARECPQCLGDIGS